MTAHELQAILLDLRHVAKVIGISSGAGNVFLRVSLMNNEVDHARAEIERVVRTQVPLGLRVTAEITNDDGFIFTFVVS